MAQSCHIVHDYPLRHITTSGTVVHATRKLNGQSKYHKNSYLTTACGRIGAENSDFIPTGSHTKTITCQNCLKAIQGSKLNDVEHTPERYVLQEKTAGLYYNSKGVKLNKWVTDVKQATLYKSKLGAVEAGTAWSPSGNRREFKSNLYRVVTVVVEVNETGVDEFRPFCFMCSKFTGRESDKDHNANLPSEHEFYCNGYNCPAERQQPIVSSVW